MEKMAAVFTALLLLLLLALLPAPLVHATLALPNPLSGVAAACVLTVREVGEAGRRELKAVAFRAALL